MINDIRQAKELIGKITDRLDEKGPDCERYLSSEECKALKQLIDECDILVQAFGPQLDPIVGNYEV